MDTPAQVADVPSGYFVEKITYEAPQKSLSSFHGLFLFELTYKARKLNSGTYMAFPLV